MGKKKGGKGKTDPTPGEGTSQQGQPQPQQQPQQPPQRQPQQQTQQTRAEQPQPQEPSKKGKKGKGGGRGQPGSSGDTQQQTTAQQQPARGVGDDGGQRQQQPQAPAQPVWMGQQQQQAQGQPQQPRQHPAAFQQQQIGSVRPPWGQQRPQGLPQYQQMPPGYPQGIQQPGQPQGVPQYQQMPPGYPQGIQQPGQPQGVPQYQQMPPGYPQGIQQPGQPQGVPQYQQMPPGYPQGIQQPGQPHPQPQGYPQHAQAQQHPTGRPQNQQQERGGPQGAQQPGQPLEQHIPPGQLQHVPPQAQRGRGRGGRGAQHQGDRHPGQQQENVPQEQPQPATQPQQLGGRGRGGRGAQHQGDRHPGQQQENVPQPATQQQQRGGRGGGRGGGRQGQQPTSQQQVQQPMSPTPSTASSVESVTKKVAAVTIEHPKSTQSDRELVSSSRIKPGTKGRRIKVESNHFELKLGNLKTAYHYDVSIDPNVPKKLMRPVMELFRQKHFSNRYPAFDGMKNIYASKPLTNNLNDIMADEIKLAYEGREKVFKVEIKFANEVDLTPLRDFLNHPATPQEALQCVDVVLRSAPVATCIPVGRSFFLKPQQIIDLGQGMEMYNGFYQSAIRGWKPLLNVDVAHKAFPKAMHCIDALIEVLTFNPRNPFQLGNRPLVYDQTETFRKFITTLRVTYEIPGNPASKRVYRVNGLDQCPQDKMFTHDGRQMTIEAYFRNVKNYRLKYPNLPTLWVGNIQRKDKILLPLELCFINEGQAVNRKMTEMQTSTMIRHSATSTDIRKNKIMNGIRTANYGNSPSIQEFGFSVGSEFQMLDARVLDPPALEYNNRQVVQPSKGVWRNRNFIKGIVISKWTIASASRYTRPDELNNMARMLKRHASECGMVFESDAEMPFGSIGGRQSLPDVKQYFQNQKSKQYQIIFVVVPDSGPQYSYVKSAAELDYGFLTQCIKGRTLQRFNPQTAVNILLKVNSKLNGTNHCLSNRPRIMARPVMIMGADVTHPSPDSTNIPSVAAVTASHDPKAFQYNICWRLQPPKVEIIQDLEAITKEQLMFFYQKTKVKPEAIVFFRDGVSEGQFQQVRDAEIRAIRAACKSLQRDGYEPKITFLVVQKRHHTRLFPKNPRDSEDKNCNVPAGTCVDTDITHPFMQDFYLVSHASIQGVAKPTKYCTLQDDNDMSNDEIEELTYHLCHMFTRCNRSVSYPAPTYYAHLAAARAKVYIENDNLDLGRLREAFNKYQIKEEIRKGHPMFFV